MDNFVIQQDNFFQREAPGGGRLGAQGLSGLGSGGMQAPMVIRLTQIDETVNVNEFEYSKVVSLFPRCGQSNIMQYSLDGKFDQLPVKLYPTFVARQDFYKLDLTLRANCRLPAHLRIKEMTVRFKAPPQILRVFVH